MLFQVYVVSRFYCLSDRIVFLLVMVRGKINQFVDCAFVNVFRLLRVHVCLRCCHFSFGAHGGSVGDGSFVPVHASSWYDFGSSSAAACLPILGSLILPGELLGCVRLVPTVAEVCIYS